MFMIRYQLATGELCLSQDFTTAGEADWWRRALLQASHAVAADVVPSDLAAYLCEIGAMARPFDTLELIGAHNDKHRDEVIPDHHQKSATSEKPLLFKEDPFMRSQSLREQLITAAVRLVALIDGPAVGQFHITVRSNVGTVLNLSAQVSQKMLADVLPAQTSPLEQAILQVVSHTPQSAKSLARLAGYCLTDHFRGGLRSLERRDFLVRKPDGYCLPSPTSLPVEAVESTEPLNGTTEETAASGEVQSSGEPCLSHDRTLNGRTHH